MAPLSTGRSCLLNAGKFGNVAAAEIQRRVRSLSSVQQRLFQTTIKKISSSNGDTATVTTAGTLPYGLKRIDYCSAPTLTLRSKPLYTLPPPPPHLYNPNNTIFKSTIQPMLAPFCVVLLIGSTIYLYLYPEKDVYEYWKQVEQGNVPVDSAYDDDDDDDDEDDDDSDEWEDKK